MSPSICDINMSSNWLCAKKKIEKIICPVTFVPPSIRKKLWSASKLLLAYVFDKSQLLQESFFYALQYKRIRIMGVDERCNSEWNCMKKDTIVTKSFGRSRNLFWCICTFLKRCLIITTSMLSMSLQTVILPTR
jgi:hypothetical protein